MRGKFFMRLLNYIDREEFCLSNGFFSNVVYARLCLGDQVEITVIIRSLD